MAYPQGFLFQPPVSLALPFSSGIILGQRTEGSAFAPYSSSATSSPGFSSHSPYGGEPRAAATISSFMVSVWSELRGFCFLRSGAGQKVKEKSHRS
uniref:Uncharacterized protein n=1 Tax=Xiphophorus couchianus TaxID=32473 RepID=A0A3B5MC42_9TELE